MYDTNCLNILKYSNFKIIFIFSNVGGKLKSVLFLDFFLVLNFIAPHKSYGNYIFESLFLTRRTKTDAL